VGVDSTGVGVGVAAGALGVGLATTGLGVGAGAVAVGLGFGDVDGLGELVGVGVADGVGVAVGVGEAVGVGDDEELDEGAGVELSMIGIAVPETVTTAVIFWLLTASTSESEIAAKGGIIPAADTWMIWELVDADDNLGSAGAWLVSGRGAAVITGALTATSKIRNS
jgi:hypothetical protein